jgi:AmiR/NasT family two-component response regulator
LGALGLFGVRPGELNEADLLVGQSLAHIACVAIVQEHAPTSAAVTPRLRNALSARVVIEQAKGFVREILDVSVEDAFTLLRHYARSNGDHLTDVARRLIAQPDSRPPILTAMAAMNASPA